MEVVDECIRAAGTAPSGAHKQLDLRDRDRPGDQASGPEAAEEEERENYGGRMNEEWLEDLRPFGTNADKPFPRSRPR